MRGSVSCGLLVLAALWFLTPFEAAGGEPPGCATEIARVPIKTFGFEVEYVPHESPKLWNFYRPENLSDSQWFDMSLEDRDLYAKKHKAELAPVKRLPSRMVKTLVSPPFLPERLIVDETENWEIIGPVSGSYGELEVQIKTLEILVGPGSYQAHVVNSNMAMLEWGVAGYTLFSADLLALRKLVAQLARYEKDATQTPGAFFLHPFLSVFSKPKQEMLLAVVRANLQGLAWGSVVPEFQIRYPGLNLAWREDRPYYKYTLANTYRTDIYGNGPGAPIRWGFEVRSAHKSLDALLTEVKAIARLMTVGFKAFEPFADIPGADVHSFEKQFPAPVVAMARAVLPEVEADDPKSNYLMYLLRPFELYADRLGLSDADAQALRGRILRARTEAMEGLSRLSETYAAMGIKKAAAKQEILVLVARFAKDSGLLPALELFLQNQIAVPATTATAAAQ